MWLGLRRLTTRGRSFVAAGLAAGLSALILGETDLLRVAVLLAVLPVLAAAYVGRTRYRLACTRQLSPSRIQVGAQSRVQLRLQNLTRLVTGTLMLEDRLPYALGSRPRLVLERLAPHQASSVAYTVRADLRGKYDVGPLQVRLTDPFGLCEVTRSFPSVDQLIVIPQVAALPAIRLAGEYTGAGESRARSVAVHGEDDAATREYRYGDDLRRVHWPSTARVGELMVRREEQPWESRATVVLDTRGHAHRGEGPTASFEWAVTATASIAVHLRQAGYRLRLVSADTDIDATDASSGGTAADGFHASVGTGLMLDYLAQVQPHRQADLSALVDRTRSQANGGVVIGLFGSLTVAEAELIAGLRGASAAGVIFFLHSASWMDLPEETRQRTDQEHRDATAALLEGGWRVLQVTPGTSLAALWPLAGRDSQGFAWRAAMAETVSGGAR